MNTNDTITLWYDLFSRELDRWMNKLHQQEKFTSQEVLKSFKFATDFADAGIRQLEIAQNKIEGIVETPVELPVSSVKSVKK